MSNFASIINAYTVNYQNQQQKNQDANKDGSKEESLDYFDRMVIYQFYYPKHNYTEVIEEIKLLKKLSQMKSNDFDPDKNPSKSCIVNHPDTKHHKSPRPYALVQYKSSQQLKHKINQKKAVLRSQKKIEEDRDSIRLEEK